MYDGAFPSFLLIILFFLEISLILFWILGNKVLMIFFFFSFTYIFTLGILLRVSYTHTRFTGDPDFLCYAGPGLCIERICLRLPWTTLDLGCCK